MVQPPLAVYVSQALSEQAALRSTQFKILLTSVVGRSFNDAVGMFVSLEFVGRAVGAAVGAAVAVNVDPSAVELLLHADPS